MNYAATNLDLIQPDQRREPTDREMADGIARIKPKLKAMPPRPEYIFDDGVCLHQDRAALREALRTRDMPEIGRLVLALFDGWCESEAHDLTYGMFMDNLTDIDRDILRDIGEYRPFRA